MKKRIIEANNIDTTKPILSLVLDMNSLLKNSMVDRRTNTKGEVYGAVMQVLIKIKKFLEMRDWNFIYACYDGYNSGILRWNIYEDYKIARGKDFGGASKMTDYDRYMSEYAKKVIEYSKRKRGIRDERDDEEDFERQREIVFECLENLFVRQFIYDSVEGDDLIAYKVINKKPIEKICIVTSDRDLTQLINDDVCVYLLDMRKFITPESHIKIMGYPHYNVVIKKILCGDDSDSIKGIKGIGEKTFFNLYPQAKTEKIDLERILAISNEDVNKRLSEHKKPLRAHENVLNRVTDGCQGQNIFEINERLIDLSKPMLTDEAKDGLNDELYAPIDPEGRGFMELYSIINKYGIDDLKDDDKFSKFFSPFNKLIDKENKYRLEFK